MVLADRVVIVSGIGPGLGRQIALRCSAAGAAVVLGARRTASLAEVSAEVEAAGGRVATAPCDITSEADCRHLVAVAMDTFGRVDCLVNNAFDPGPMNDPVVDADLDRWRQAFEVNLFGTMQMVRAAVPALRSGQCRSIVVVNSQITRRVRAGRGAYATSKSALLTLVQVLARELGPDRIRVNSVVPGAMDGPPLRSFLQRSAGQSGTTVDALYRDRTAPLSLPALPTDADCAGAVVFLASDLSAAMTGQAIDVNGGETFH